MTSPHEQALAAAVEALCQASLFDGDGHGCGGCCQAKVRFGKEAEATVRAYLAALPASDLADGLVVKPLAWEPVETWKQCSKERAKAFGGEYQIVMLDPDDDDPLPSLYFEIGLGAFMFRFEQAQDPMGLPGETCPRKFPSVEAAKAAAQSDYERRIRSAIDTTALSAKLAAVERERDTLTERLAEMETGRPDDCETIVDRLRSLAIRREQEGIYTDAAIAERAAEIIEGVGAMSMSVDLSANDGQPDEQQEWHDYDPDC